MWCSFASVMNVVIMVPNKHHANLYICIYNIHKQSKNRIPSIIIPASVQACAIPVSTQPCNSVPLGPWLLRRRGRRPAPAPSGVPGEPKTENFFGALGAARFGGPRLKRAAASLFFCGFRCGLSWFDSLELLWVWLLGDNQNGLGVQGG